MRENTPPRSPMDELVGEDDDDEELIYVGDADEVLDAWEQEEAEDEERKIVAVVFLHSSTASSFSNDCPCFFPLVDAEAGPAAEQHALRRSPVQDDREREGKKKPNPEHDADFGEHACVRTHQHSERVRT